MQQFVNQILHGDALTKLKEIPDNYVDCIITSPPYWALRDYKTEGLVWDGDSNCKHEWNTKERYIHRGTTKSKKLTEGMITEGKTIDSFCSKCNAWKGQLGQEPTIDLFVNHLVQIFDECKRVLKKEGTCWVVIGDTYNTRTITNKDRPKWGELQRASKSTTTYFPKQSLKTMQHKSLCMIPERFAIAMIDKGWILRNKIIWHKRNCMPSSAKDRFTIDYEFVYFFTKSQKYYFKTQLEPYLEPIKRWGGNIEKIHNGKSLDKIYGCSIKNGQKIRPNPLGRIKRCVWTINTKPFSEAHFAVFPESLVQQCLDAGCPPDGIVLDPFMGSGTTALVALKHNRKFIGIELNQDYIKIANKRLDPYLKQQKLIVN